MMKYTCPKCRCGCLFEHKNRLICMNCDAEVLKVQAVGIRHEHPHRTYAAGSGTKPVVVPRPSPGQVTPSGSDKFPQLKTTTVPSGAGTATKKKASGCGTMVWIYIAIGILYAIFRSLG